jgi:hypothetical protein
MTIVTTRSIASEKHDVGNVEMDTKWLNVSAQRYVASTARTTTKPFVRYALHGSRRWRFKCVGKMPLSLTHLALPSPGSMLGIPYEGFVIAVAVKATYRRAGTFVIFVCSPPHFPHRAFHLQLTA